MEDKAQLPCCLLSWFHHQLIGTLRPQSLPSDSLLTAVSSHFPTTWSPGGGGGATRIKVHAWSEIDLMSHNNHNATFGIGAKIFNSVLVPSKFCPMYFSNIRSSPNPSQVHHPFS